MGFQQIQAPTLRELFVDQVIGMIFSGELRVGDRLPSERELSEQMHISRSMVHRATVKPSRFICRQTLRTP